MEKFFMSDDLPRTQRIARLLSRLYHTTVYIDEDFGSDNEDDPWGFFVTTNSPKNLYATYTNGVSAY